MSKIQTISWNRKSGPITDLENRIAEKMRGQFFSRVELHEQGNYVIVILYAGEGKPTQQVKMFGPGDLDNVVAQVNAIQEEVTGEVVLVTPVGDNRVVGMIITSPAQVEAGNGGTETKGQDAKVNGGSNTKRQRSGKPSDSRPDGGGTS